jgi:hypothetical protein
MMMTTATRMVVVLPGAVVRRVAVAVLLFF